MATVHDLKTWPENFKDVLICPDGQHPIKPFEVRKDDRDYKVGDVLWLREWCPGATDYTGCHCKREVTYILRGAQFVKDGYCIMGIKPCVGGV